MSKVSLETNTKKLCRFRLPIEWWMFWRNWMTWLHCFCQGLWCQSLVWETNVTCTFVIYVALHVLGREWDLEKIPCKSCNAVYASCHQWNILHNYKDLMSLVQLFFYSSISVFYINLETVSMNSMKTCNSATFYFSPWSHLVECTSC